MKTKFGCEKGGFKQMTKIQMDVAVPLMAEASQH